jgi:hypothetical protein
MLQKTDICRVMIRQLEGDNENKELLLQIMINISGDEHFAKIFIDFNVIYRISTLLFSRLEKSDVTLEADDLFEFAKEKLDVKYSKIF